MKKFEVGKMYQDRAGKSHKCIKRTDKSVWFDNGHLFRIDTDKDGNECVTAIVRVDYIQASEEC